MEDGRDLFFDHVGRGMVGSGIDGNGIVNVERDDDDALVALVRWP